MRSDGATSPRRRGTEAAGQAAGAGAASMSRQPAVSQTHGAIDGDLPDARLRRLEALQVRPLAWRFPRDLANMGARLRSVTRLDPNQAPTVRSPLISFSWHVTSGSQHVQHEAVLHRSTTGPPLCRGCRRASMVLTMFWGDRGLHGGRGHRRPARVAAAQLRQRVPDLRPPAAAATPPRRSSPSAARALIGTAFHVVQRTCRARLFGGAPLGWFVLLGYQFFIVVGRDRLPARHHPEQGIRRARMVRRPAG